MRDPMESAPVFVVFLVRRLAHTYHMPEIRGALGAMLADVRRGAIAPADMPESPDGAEKK